MIGAPEGTLAGRGNSPGGQPAGFGGVWTEDSMGSAAAEVAKAGSKGGATGEVTAVIRTVEIVAVER